MTSSVSRLRESVSSALRNFLDSRKNSAQKSAGKKKRVESDSTLSSQSLQKNTTVFLPNKGAAAVYAGALLHLAKDTQLITITKLDSSEGYFVSCATSAFSEPGVQRFLSKLPNTSVTHQP